MEKNNKCKITLSSLIMVGMIIIICIMACIIYEMKMEYTYLEEKDQNVTTYYEKNGNLDTDDIEYTITIRDEMYATIKAIQDGNEISKEFELGAMIDKTGTMDIKNIGKVALVSYSGGEACVVNVYQLINNEIKLLGSIDCGADMVNEASYTANIKDEITVVITANRNNETITNEFEMAAAIDYMTEVDILDYGKVVFVAESGGEHYGIQVYRLSQDYITGKTEEIRNVGLIEDNKNDSERQ
ncbi:MAG: hypothetical protein IKL55_01680 [Clostridia bacterium]|nr:hypothetical protein [Clostridia bacterium]